MLAHKLPWFLGFGIALLCGTGCGNYKITFELGEVINAYGDAQTRQALDVDILCLTKAETDKYPEIVNKSMRSDEWFKLRRESSAKLANIDPSHVYALRTGEKDSRDQLLGGPLTGWADRANKEKTITFNVSHSSSGNGRSAIVIYGRFMSREGAARTEPIVIMPPPGWFDSSEIRVRVDQTSMQLVETK